MATKEHTTHLALDQSFFALTPERILAAVEAFGFRCSGRALALNSLENRVYEAEIVPESSIEIKSKSDSFRVAKFYRPGRWSREQILEEHQFLFDLEAAEIPVVSPLRDRNGDTVLELPGSGIYYALFPKRGGRHEDELDDARLQILGRLIARMHSVGAQRELKHRGSLDAKTFGENNLTFLLSHPALLPQYAPRLEQIGRQLIAMTTPWFNESAKIRLHGDFHLGNVLWDYQKLVVMDLDDCITAPPVQDIWLIIPGRDDESRRKQELLLSAYEQMRQFDRASLRLIEPLRALRMIHFSAWIAKRWDDPIFKGVFVEFGSERYWAEQISALQESLMLASGVEF